MSRIEFIVEEGGKRSATITVPIWLARSAASLCSKMCNTQKIDFAAVLKAAEEPETDGLILQIEDHAGGEKVTISIVR